MAHDESAGGMELVENEELAARQLHNQRMISRMIMRNEWRTDRLPPNWFEGVRFFFVPSWSNEGNKNVIRLSEESSRRSVSLFTLL